MAQWQNNGRIKLMIIVGTRPEIIRLAAVIRKCRKYFDTILVHTGQNYDYSLNGVFFKDLGIADPELYLNAAGADLGETMGKIIAASYTAMAELQPDAVLVLGDTNSCLSVIGAKRLHIPIFHMEAGNRCKDECLPEETNRRIVDIISDVNLAYSEHARRYLAECGLPRNEIFLATKMWPTEMGYEETKEAFARSCRKLRTDYIDLYLIHWPKRNPQDLQWRQKIRDTWRAMEELYKEGKCRAIGVCNFQPHHLQVILDESDRMANLVSDMATISLMSRHEASLNLTDFDLVPLTAEILASYDIYVIQQGYDFRFTSPKECMVNADRDRIAQVISNLLSNAIKYCGEDKVVIVNIKRVGKKFRLEVSDHGPGIKQEELPHVWDRYYTTSSNYVRATTGSGLGLSIVKEILTLHKAGYGVTSKEGKGTTFWFELENGIGAEET